MSGDAAVGATDYNLDSLVNQCLVFFGFFHHCTGRWEYCIKCSERFVHRYSALLALVEECIESQERSVLLAGMLGLVAAAQPTLQYLEWTDPRRASPASSAWGASRPCTSTSSHHRTSNRSLTYACPGWPTAPKEEVLFRFCIGDRCFSPTQALALLVIMSLTYASSTRECMSNACPQSLELWVGS